MFQNFCKTHLFLYQKMKQPNALKEKIHDPDEFWPDSPYAKLLTKCF